MTGPWDWWPAVAIASAAECPLEHVTIHWPKLFEQLGHCRIQTPNVGIGVIGTTAIESASQFAPVREAFYLGEPEPAESHRKTLEYYPYYGRGEIQLTWESNYRTYGPKVAQLWGADPGQPDFDLVSKPDNALNPDVAAAVMGLYFRDTRALPSPSYPAGYTLVQACEEQDWEWVRRLVYGGPDPAGAERIGQIAAELGPPGGQVVPEPGPPPSLVYNAEQSPERQIQDWTCSIRTTTWMLKSLGVDVSAAAMQDYMVPTYVTPTAGLLDGRGYGLADVLRAHLPSGTEVTVREHASWDDVYAWAGDGPIGMGSNRLYHWLAVRRPDDEGQLAGMNPAPGYQAVGDQITRAEFEQWAPWNVVRVPVEEGAVGPPDTEYARPGEVGSGVLSMMTADGTEPACPSTWLPLGAVPGVIEQCTGLNGTVYAWHIPTGRSWRYQPE